MSNLMQRLIIGAAACFSVSGTFAQSPSKSVEPSTKEVKIREFSCKNKGSGCQISLYDRLGNPLLSSDPPVFDKNVGLPAVDVGDGLLEIRMNGAPRYVKRGEVSLRKAPTGITPSKPCINSSGSIGSSC